MISTAFIVTMNFYLLFSIFLCILGRFMCESKNWKPCVVENLKIKWLELLYKSNNCLLLLTSRSKNVLIWSKKSFLHPNPSRNFIMALAVPKRGRPRSGMKHMAQMEPDLSDQLSIGAQSCAAFYQRSGP